jgi:hypothetical protein
MLRNTMTEDRLNLFCLVDGEPQSNVFSVKPSPADTVDDLKKLIKTEKTNQFSDVDADQLTLWRVSISVVPANKHKPIVLNEVESPTELEPTDDVSDVFDEPPPKKTIHIIVQRPPPGNALTRLLLFVTCCWNELRYSILMLSSLCRPRVGV